MTKFFNSAAFKDYAYTFLSVILFMFLADGADVFSVSTDDLRQWLAAGIGAALRPIVAAIDASDLRYGRKSA